MKVPLPSFTDHAGHTKRLTLDRPAEDPEKFVLEWIEKQRSNLSLCKVLDLGCGTGGRVAWLTEAGFDAWGVDVRTDYVEAGRQYFEARGMEHRLRVMEDGQYPFESNSFDVVISDQVFEHVDDLEGLAREVARVSRDGATGLHVFPAHWKLVEPHMHTPFAHWFPKGRLRRMAISFALLLRADARYFPNMNHGDRVEIYNRFSVKETFYRSPDSISRMLAKYGIICKFVESVKLSGKLHGVESEFLGKIYRTCHGVYLETRC